MEPIKRIDMSKGDVLRLVMSVIVATGGASALQAKAQGSCNGMRCDVFATRPLPPLMAGGGGGWGGGTDNTDQSNNPHHDPQHDRCMMVINSTPPGCDLRNPPQLVVNGCGSVGSEAIPDYIVSPVLATEAVSLGGIFKPACDAHDMCYATLGMSKDACDENLRVGMIAEAQRRMSPLQYAALGPYVHAQAWAYAKGLQWSWVQARYSGPAFEQAQRDASCRVTSGSAAANGCL